MRCDTGVSQHTARYTNTVSTTAPAHETRSVCYVMEDKDN